MQGPVPPRRDFDIGMLAINELWKKMPDLEVIFAGWDVSNYEIPFPHQNLGTVTPQVLADSYVKCDMCLIISNTNLSLLPLKLWLVTLLQSARKRKQHLACQ